jgi:hypothetical protein
MQIADKILMRSVESLIPYARNAQTHSDAHVAQIAGSIREFGFTNPVLVDGEKSAHRHRAIAVAAFRSRSAMRDRRRDGGRIADRGSACRSGNLPRRQVPINAAH